MTHYFIHRLLEACYPQFPSEKSFLNTLQGEENIMNEKNGLRMLTRFALEKERLEVRINTLSFDYYLSLSLSL